MDYFLDWCIVCGRSLPPKIKKTNNNLDSNPHENHKSLKVPFRLSTSKITNLKDTLYCSAKCQATDFRSTFNQLPISRKINNSNNSQSPIINHTHNSSSRGNALKPHPFLFNSDCETTYIVNLKSDNIQSDNKSPRLKPTSPTIEATPIKMNKSTINSTKRLIMQVDHHRNNNKSSIASSTDDPDIIIQNLIGRHSIERKHSLSLESSIKSFRNIEVKSNIKLETINRSNLKNDNESQNFKMVQYNKQSPKKVSLLSSALIENKTNGENHNINNISKLNKDNNMQKSSSNLLYWCNNHDDHHSFSDKKTRNCAHSSNNQTDKGIITICEPNCHWNHSQKSSPVNININNNIKTNDNESVMNNSNKYSRIPSRLKIDITTMSSTPVSPSMIAGFLSDSPEKFSLKSLTQASNLINNHNTSRPLFFASDDEDFQLLKNNSSYITPDQELQIEF